MDIIVVSDTNIFIDLYKVDLLDEFFSLTLHIHTTDLIIHELKAKEQKDKILAYNKLFIKKFNMQEMMELVNFQRRMQELTNVSIQDCSVWAYAQHNDYTLLTGDGKLRKIAIKEGTNVRGILYIFDKMVEEKLLTPQKACEKIQLLRQLNGRLPSKEIDKRICIWSKPFLTSPATSDSDTVPDTTPKETPPPTP